MKDKEDNGKKKGKKGNSNKKKKTRVGGHYLDMKRTTKNSAGRILKEIGTRKQWDEWLKTGLPCFQELDLSLMQERVLFGLWTLQEKKKKICFTMRSTELYAAMGLRKHHTNRAFSKRETEEVDKALRELNNVLVTVAYRRYKEQYDESVGKMVTRQVAVFYPATKLLDISFVDADNAYDGLSKEEKAKGILKNCRYIRVELKDHLVADIEEYYRLIPSTLYEDIKDYNQKRERRTIVQEPRFIEWLFAQRKDEVTIKRLTLAKALKMYRAIEERKWAEIDQIIARCYEVAWNLQYLEKCKMEKKDAKNAKDTLWLKVSRFPNLR